MEFLSWDDDPFRYTHAMDDDAQQPSVDEKINQIAYSRKRLFDFIRRKRVGAPGGIERRKIDDVPEVNSQTNHKAVQERFGGGGFSGKIRAEEVETEGEEKARKKEQTCSTEDQFRGRGITESQECPFGDNLQ